ncbi:MAG TPA: glycosyltransferase family 87 protein, partial [Stellaceae bacterium]|nr:glycosyltransferase family 87 protein [Stellaceae bacterium]
TLQAEHALALGHPSVQHYYWFYPPIFLLLVTPFALLPYVPAVIVWVAATLALYLAALRRIFPHPLTALAALAAPTACAGIITAQNGFLTAALLGGGLFFLESQPVLAGALLGTLAIKPQLALLIPVVLLGARQFRAAAAAALTVLGLAALSAAVLGFDAWSAFLAAPFHANDKLFQHSTVGLYKIQSLYALLRFLDLDPLLAGAVQGAASLVVAALVLRLWRRDLPYAVKAAALATGTLLVTPYAMIYDMTLLSVPAAFLVRDGVARGFRPWEKPGLVIVGLLPILFPWISAIGLVSEFAMLALVLLRASQAED